MSREKRRFQRWMPLIVWGSLAVALIVLLLSGEAGRMARVLSEAQPGYVLLLIPVGMCLPFVHAWRWQAMLRAIGHEVPLSQVVEMTVTSTLLNYSAPGYLWSPTKGLLVRQLHGVGFARSFPTLAAEQGLDALALVIGTTLALLLTGGATWDSLSTRVDRPDTVLLALAIIVVVALCVAGLVVGRRYARRFLDTVRASASMLAANKRERPAILLLTVARWLLDVAAIWLAAEALGVRLDPGQALLLSNLPLLIGLLSPVPGGIGFREGAMAAVAGALGLVVSAILAAAILHRALLVIGLTATLGVTRVFRRPV